jgi:hypothetical protein
MGGGRKGEEAVTRVVGLLAGARVWSRVGHLDANGLPLHEVTDLLGVFFIHPRFEIAPPKGRACGDRRRLGLGLGLPVENGVAVGGAGRRIYGRRRAMVVVVVERWVVSVWFSVLSLVLHRQRS